MFSRLCLLIDTPIECRQTEVTVRDERAHAARLGEFKRFTVVGLAALGIEPVRMGHDLAEQVEGMSCKAVMTPREFHRTIAEVPRLVQSAEQQAGATEQVVRPAAMEDDSSRHVAFEEMFAFPQPLQCLACLTALR